MDTRKLIEQINENCRKSVCPSFNLSLLDNQHNSCCWIINGTSQAVNRFDYPQESVQVLKWFDDFWLFLAIKFFTTKKVVNKKLQTQTDTVISLSIFQGTDNDNGKYQLFRAEWDDYNNSEEKHAQPHWHITSSQAIENTFAKYADDFDKQDFLQLLESEKQKVFDVKKIHFAMNGNWKSNDNHIHEIKDEQQIVRWLQGMLSHLRTELEG
jgi:hypothetical protein